MTVEGKPDASGVKPEASGEGEGDKVSIETYKRTLAQRKADKARADALAEENAALKAEKETAEAQRMADEKRFKDLYETEKKKREASDARINEMTQAQITNAKKSALSKELGGVKSEYLVFADLASIQMGDDGEADPESVKEAANKFRAKHPELLPAKSGGTLPNNAPKDHTPKPPKLLSEMTAAELKAVIDRRGTN